MVAGYYKPLLRDYQMPFYLNLVTKSFTPTPSLISHWLILTIYIAY